MTASHIYLCILITPAEHRVLLELTWDGANNREIARRLKCSEDTVKTHMQSIMRKVPHVRDRTALVTGLLRKTIITRVVKNRAVARAHERLDTLASRQPGGRQAPRLGRRYAALARQ